jgi:hypothetical protein
VNGKWVRVDRVPRAEISPVRANVNEATTAALLALIWSAAHLLTEWYNAPHWLQAAAWAGVIGSTAICGDRLMTARRHYRARRRR